MQSSQVGRHLKQFLLENTSLNIICLYVATPFELGVLSGILDDASLNNRQFYLPRIQPEQKLSWHHVPMSHPLKLKQHPKFNLQEPPPHWPSLNQIPDLVIVPCLMMDAQGVRLGYGSGYYDRQLQDWSARGATAPLALGIVLESCLLPALPCEPHDIPLNGWITEVGIQQASVIPTRLSQAGAMTG